MQRGKNEQSHISTGTVTNCTENYTFRVIAMQSEVLLYEFQR